MSDTKQSPPRPAIQNPNAAAVRVAFDPLRPTEKPQDYYDEIKQKFAEARDLRLSYRPDGRAQYTSDLTGELAKYEIDPYAGTPEPRDPINDTVECLFIGGGFSALLTAARLREKGVESIRIVERGGDVGGTWYWNRYPGAACDVSAYDYLPLLDELDYVPGSFFAKGPEIFATLPGDRPQIRSVRSRGISDHGHVHRMGSRSETLAGWHRSRRHDVGEIRDLRQWHAFKAEAVQRSRAWSASRDIPSTRRASTTITPSPIFPASRTRSSASSAPARPPCRSFRASAGLRRHCMSSSARRPRSISATTFRPIPIGRQH